MKQLTAQIAALYLGCEVTMEDGPYNYRGKLVGVNREDLIINHDDEQENDWKVSAVKLILRPLVKLSDEHAMELHDLLAEHYPGRFALSMQSLLMLNFSISVTETNFLRSKGYDCDGLLESGLAIEKQ